MSDYVSIEGQSTTLNTGTSSGSKPQAEPIKSTSGAAHVNVVSQLSGESLVFDRMFGGPMCYAYSLTADGQIGVAGPTLFYGYMVTTALSAAVINVRDATAAGTGTIIDIVAASAAAGTTHFFPAGIYCANGAYADFAGTGTVTFFALPSV